jgi:hypothetical protein
MATAKGEAAAQTWRDQIKGAMAATPVMGLVYYLIDNFRHKDCISIEEHRRQIDQWIEAVKFCQQFYTGGS